MKHVLVGKSSEGWMCFTTENQRTVDECLSSGGRELSNKEIEDIFGNLVDYISSETTSVSNDGKSITFNPPSLGWQIEKRSEELKQDINYHIAECNHIISNSNSPYHKKVWSNYKKQLLSLLTHKDFPWFGIPLENIPWPTRPNSTPETLEEVKEMQFSTLSDSFEKWMESSETSFMSSLGIEVNANTTAKRNVDSLITELEFAGEKSIDFMCFDNKTVKLTLDQLKILQIELIVYGKEMYKKKWEYRSKIENAKNMAEALNIVFDFSTVSIN